MTAINSKCPICNDAEPMSDACQPQPSLHACTIFYECGSEIIYVIGQNGYVTEKRCDEIKSEDL